MFITLSPDEWQIESNTLASLFAAGEIDLEQWFHASAALGPKPVDPPDDLVSETDAKPDINAIPPWPPPSPRTTAEIERDELIAANAAKAEVYFAGLKAWLDQPIKEETPTKEEP